jgi:hypothetical protein
MSENGEAFIGLVAPRELHTALHARAKFEHRTASAIIRELVRGYLAEAIPGNDKDVGGKPTPLQITPTPRSHTNERTHYATEKGSDREFSRSIG